MSFLWRALIETAMNVTFPTLMTEFNTDSSGIQWVTTGYLLAIAIVVPITAYLTRNYTIRQLSWQRTFYLSVGS